MISQTTGAVSYSASPTSPVRIGVSQRIVPFLPQFAVVFLMVASILAPVVTVSSALPWFRVEQLALIPIGFVYLWLLLAALSRPVRSNALFVIGPVYCGCILLSLAYGTFVLDHAFLLRDLYEIPKVLLPVVFFTLGLEARLTETWLRRLLSAVSVAIILVCLYGWAQWMDLGISHQLNLVYSGGAHDDGALAHYRRVYSTMGNPNLLGEVLTWVIAALTLAILFRVGNRLRNLCVVGICLVTLAMTGSRYGLVDTGLAFLLIFLLSASVRHRRRTMAVFLLILLPAFAWIVFLVARSNQATLERFRSLQDPLQTDSFRGRLDDLWPAARREFIKSPILGQGPAKDVFTGVITDSEYLDVLKEFGIVGFGVYILYFLYPLRILWKGLKCSARGDPLLEVQLPASFLALHLSFIILFTALVMNVGMGTLYAEPIQGFFWLWIGIGVSAAQRIASGIWRLRTS